MKPLCTPVMHTAFGEEKSLKEWVRDPRCLVGYHTLQGRRARGMSIEEAMSIPGNGEVVTPVQNPVPSRNFGNFSMPPNSYVPPFMGRL